MKQSGNSLIVISYLLTGFFVGLAFLFFVYIIQIVASGYFISFESVKTIHAQFPAIFILDLLPFLLAFIAYLTGKFLHESLRKSNTETDQAKQINKKVYDFVENLRTGNTNVEFQFEGYDEPIGNALVKLQNRINETQKEEENRKKEDAQRSWIAEGLAKFGDILRLYNNDIEKLSYNIIKDLVLYIDAKQAGFFVLNENNTDGDRYFELMAMFAYDRRKFAQRIIPWGDGLIGTCALEKASIYLTKIPDGYVYITSGLGQSTPKSLLIVPLLVNDEIHGVIEIASFKEYEKFEIEFVERVAESIASTLSSLKINMRTAMLLKETREQTEAVALQEEAMRNSMIELRRTQEEKERQSRQFINFTNSVNHTMIRAEYEVDGTLVYANTKFIEELGYMGNSEVESRHISMFISQKDREWFDDIWSTIAAGGKHFEGDMKHVTKQGKDVWINATYVSVRDENGVPEKILFLGIDTTTAKKQSLDFEGQISALNLAILKAEFHITGKFIESNQLFSNSVGYSAIELKDLTIFHLINNAELNKFRLIWKNVVNSVHYEGAIMFIDKNGNEAWIQGTFTAVNDMYGEVAKVILIASDITEQKKIELKAQKQTEQLKIQEKRLQQSQVELSRKLQEAREEMKSQFKEIETVKLLNERALEGLLDAVVTINHNNIIEFFNKAAESLWGYTKGEVLNRNIEVLLPAEFKGNNDNYLGNFFYSGSEALIGKRTEVFIINRRNEEVAVLVTLSQAQVGGESTLTAFIQNIEVELF
ncbi:MAG TPA: hypothetical protein DCQ31_07170 [Bacteroidales bacterium]|nr:hypothetical protein [Bacteroidales bacterium]